LFRNEGFLREKYISEGLSARSIAVLIGCGHDVVNRALWRYGITITKKRSGHVPYGQRMNKQQKLIPHVRQQKIIATMRKWKAKNFSNAEIARRLEQKCILSPSGLKHWQPCVVRRILGRSEV
jgi:hypothetical protein